MSNIKITIFLTLLASSFSSGCSEKKITKSPKSPALQLGQEKPKLDPKMASVRLPNPVPTNSPATVESTLMVPTLSMVFAGADMVQVLRCVEGVPLITATGQDIKTLGSATGDLRASILDQKRWVWQELWGQQNKCKVIGTNITRSTYPDLAAGTGRFFYIVNPCVSQSRSISGKEGCSYDIAVSEVIEAKNTLDAEFVLKAQELAQMEGVLSTHFSSLFYYARQIRDKTRVCEDTYAFEQTKGSFFQGLLTLAAGVAGAVVGFYIGGGIQGSTTGASLFMGIASAIFAKPPEGLDCPVVESFIEQATHTTSLLQPQVARVIELRGEMAQLQAGYAAFDATIAGETGNAQAVTPAQESPASD